MNSTLWHITLRPPADPKDPQGVHRVRMALKCLLRSFGLTCTDVSKAEASCQIVKMERTEDEQ